MCSFQNCYWEVAAEGAVFLCREMILAVFCVKSITSNKKKKIDPLRSKVYFCDFDGRYPPLCL